MVKGRLMEKIFGIALVGLMVWAMLSSLPGTVNADKCVPIDETKLNVDEKEAFSYVKKYAEEQGVSPALLMAIIKQENSRFNSSEKGDFHKGYNGENEARAFGYMQVWWPAAYDAGFRGAEREIPEGSELKEQYDWFFEKCTKAFGVEPTANKFFAYLDWQTSGVDKDKNIKYGCGYFKILYNQWGSSSVYGNSLKNAISAYNRGRTRGPGRSNENEYVNPVFQNYESYGECPEGQWCEEGECVPEASTLVLFAVGLLSLVGYLGFRRKED